MEINRQLLMCILRKTTCEWTKGYISRVLEDQMPTRNQTAVDIIDGAGSPIEAIKALRNVFGLSLKASKDIVDEYRISGNIVGLDDGDDCLPIS